MRSKPGLLVCLLLALAASLHAQQTIHVPADQPTIQAGIDAANTGDTVLVTPGTYNENIDFKGKAITVTSSGGASVTILDGGQTAPAVVFSSAETRASTLSGFTIQHGGVFNYSIFVNGGIYLKNSSPTIRNNILTQNNCWTIYSESAAPLIQSNEISATQDPKGQCSFGGGAGIYISGNLNQSAATNDGSAALIIGNTIEDNVESGFEDAGGNGGAGIAVWAGSPVILNNIIRNNASPGGSGGAINLQSGVGVAVVQNLIYGNSAGCGGGAIATQAYTDPRTGISALIANNTMVNNTGEASGGFSECAAIAQIYPSPDTYGLESPAALFINNIVTGSTSAPAVNCSSLTPASESHQPTFENDILHNSGGPFFGSYCIDVSGEYNNIAADPQLVNASTGDFHLLSTSPAIDHGQNAVLQVFQNLTGLTLSKDFDGNPRIQGASAAGCTIDIGAYEYPRTGSNCGTTETLVSSLNPSTFGQSVTFTAQLSSSTGVPTGDVQFTDGSTVLGTEAISPAGVATLSISQLSVGPHPITATYQPTGNYPAATASLTQIVNGDATTITVTSSLNPSTYGQPVTFSAHVASSAAANGTPTGTVTFTDGSNPLATVPLDGSGSAIYIISTLGVGTHPITATYLPTGSFESSTALLQQVVDGLPTIATIAASPGGEVGAGQSIVLAATVTPAMPPGAGVPTGVVTFLDGAAALGEGTLSNGTATISVSAIARGAHQFSCTYAGDAVYAPVACNIAQVTALGETTAFGIRLNPDPVPAGSTFTATVVLSGNNALAPGQPIQLTVAGGAPVTLITDVTGTAVYTLSLPSPGVYPITASFAGNATLLPGSLSVSETVTAPVSSFTIAVAPTILTLADGTQGTAAINLTSIGDFAGPLTLTVGAVPTHTAASFSTPSVTLTAGGTGTANLLINTAFATAAHRAPPRPGERTWPIVASALLLLPLTAIRSRRLRQLLLVLAAVALTQALTGCTVIRTPYALAAPGTYQLPITATDTAGNQRFATLTVVVTPQ